MRASCVPHFESGRHAFKAAMASYPKDAGKATAAKMRCLRAMASDPYLSGEAVKTAILILDRINTTPGDRKEGYAFPSVERLIEDRQGSRRAIFRHIKELCSRGYLVKLPGGGNKTGGNGRANAYTIDWKRFSADTVPEVTPLDEQDEYGTGSEPVSDPHTVPEMALNGATSGTHTVPEVAPQSSNVNPLIESSKHPSRGGAGAPGERWFDEWMEKFQSPAEPPVEPPQLARQGECVETEGAKAGEQRPRLQPIDGGKKDDRDQSPKSVLLRKHIGGALELRQVRNVAPAIIMLSNFLDEALKVAPPELVDVWCSEALTAAVEEDNGTSLAFMRCAMDLLESHVERARA